MLAELLAFALAPCPKYARRMGYLHEAIAIGARYRRCAEHWAGHLGNTKNAVRRAVGLCGKRERAIVLGSGLLLDLPLGELAASFREVVLADVVHLRSVRREARRYGNVRLVSCDITGVAERIFRAPSVLPEPEALLPAVCSGTDEGHLVISLNILSQLPLIPARFARDKGARRDEDALAAWKELVMKAHYEALKSLACPVCLVSDCESVSRDRNGDLIERRSTVGGLRLSDAQSSWVWDIAPIGEKSWDFSVQLNVEAFFWNFPAP